MMLKSTSAKAIFLGSIHLVLVVGCVSPGFDCTRAEAFFGYGCFTNCTSVCEATSGTRLNCVSQGGIGKGSVLANAFCEECKACFPDWLQIQMGGDLPARRIVQRYQWHMRKYYMKRGALRGR